VELSTEQGRVIGCLIEKQLTTPQQYPLTLNALVLACNQTSNRDPVVCYEEGSVQRTLSTLKELGIVRFVYPSSGRSATRYRHVVGESLRLDDKGLALLAVLLLRGPQTAGELRIRTERMASFEGLAELTSALEELSTRPDPLVLQLARRPGQKEERWVQLLTPGAPFAEAVSGSRTGAHDERDFALPPATRTDNTDPPRPAARSDTDLATLSSEVAAVRAELAELRETLRQLQERFLLD
jgi:hypothetical protein